ncbi:UNVERIFIED_CONTAM: hypothetical protein HHA_453400 [Hammondia hammondi]|eukprot:XP_008886726.1 hypothetical protein HHA_453400 [Hammondia hammondi]
MASGTVLPSRTSINQHTRRPKRQEVSNRAGVQAQATPSNKRKSENRRNGVEEASENSDYRAGKNVTTVANPLSHSMRPS